MGKIRLVAELVAAARPDVCGSCGRLCRTRARLGGTSWIRALRSLAASFDRHVLLEELGGDVEKLSRLVPDLRSGMKLAGQAEPEGDVGA